MTSGAEIWHQKINVSQESNMIETDLDLCIDEMSKLLWKTGRKLKACHLLTGWEFWCPKISGLMQTRFGDPLELGFSEASGASLCSPFFTLRAQNFYTFGVWKNFRRDAIIIKTQTSLISFMYVLFS